MLDRIRKNLKNKLLKQKLKKENIIIKENSKFRKTTFEGSNLIGKNVDVEKSFIGFGSAIGDNSELANCKIGKFCSIGPNTNIALGKHPTRDFVSTHNFCFDSIDLGVGLSFLDEVKYHEKYRTDDAFYISIGNDVWTGKNVTILSGVSIGDGAIIAAGAVVTKDIEPYSIVGGVPAKLIRKRFSESQIEFLLNYSWWDKDINWIKDNVELFGNIEKFTSELSK